MSLAGYEISVETEFYEVEIGNNGGVLQSSLAKAGNAPILIGQDSVSVSFNTALDLATNFTLICTLQNTLDSFPQDLTVRVSALTVNGFTARVNAPVESANYSINWALLPRING
jgi:hypothetical protein